MPLPTDDNIDFLLCDAVRQNRDGKLDIAGYFPIREVKLDRGTPLPAAINLTFLFIIKDGAGRFRGTFCIFDPLGKELHRQDLNEVVKPPDQAHVLMLGVARIPVVNPGNFAAVLELDGQRFNRSVRIFQ